MGLHRERTCEVCGIVVMAEWGAPRTYEVDDLSRPHYCQPADVSAKLASSRALLDAVVVMPPTAWIPPALPEVDEDIPIYERPEYTGTAL